METLSKEEFVVKAIERLRNEKSKGIHVVYSGFNDAFELKYGEKSAATTNAMIASGVLEFHPTTGGIMIYKKGEAPKQNRTAQALKTLAKIEG